MQSTKIFFLSLAILTFISTAHADDSSSQSDQPAQSSGSEDAKTSKGDEAKEVLKNKGKEAIQGIMGLFGGGSDSSK